MKKIFFLLIGFASFLSGSFCPYCHDQMLNDGNLRRHIGFSCKKNPNRSVQEFRCTKCEEDYSTQHNLEEHLKKPHSHTSLGQCVRCGKDFFVEGSQWGHGRKCKNPIQCSCERVFTKTTDLKRHCEEYQNDEHKPYGFALYDSKHEDDPLYFRCKLGEVIRKKELVYKDLNFSNPETCALARKLYSQAFTDKCLNPKDRDSILDEHTQDFDSLVETWHQDRKDKPGCDAVRTDNIYYAQSIYYDAKMAGVCLFSFVDNGKLLYIQRIAINERFFGKGVGTKFIERLAALEGVEAVSLQANQENFCKFYKKLGFVRMSRDHRYYTQKLNAKGYSQLILNIQRNASAAGAAAEADLEGTAGAAAISVDNENYCERCDQTFWSKENADRHKLMPHSQEPLGSCDYCGTNFYTTNAPRLHGKTCDKSKVSLRCSCGACFNRDSNLKRHVEKLNSPSHSIVRVPITAVLAASQQASLSVLFTPPPPQAFVHDDVVATTALAQHGVPSADQVIPFQGTAEIMPIPVIMPVPVEAYGGGAAAALEILTSAS